VTFHPTAALGALLSLAGAVLVLLTRQGTLSGAVAGLVMALLAAAGLGAGALLPLATFVLGSGLLTRVGRARKASLGAAEPDQGRRGARHVLAKLSLPAAASAMALFRAAPPEILALVYVASLAGAFADTAATEIGPLTGGRALGFRGWRLVPVPHGAPGGMSPGGILTAAAAAGMVAASAFGVGLLDTASATWTAGAAGFLASLFESLLAGTSLGARAGHFGRNVALSIASAGLALSARALGWTGNGP
jgi:uncharacterized protein (TIGR00297 family)